MSGPKDVDWYLSDDMIALRNQERERRLELERLSSLIYIKKNEVTANVEEFKNFFNNLDKSLEEYESCKKLAFERNSIAEKTFDEFNNILSRDIDEYEIQNNTDTDTYEENIIILENYLNELDIYNENIINDTLIIKDIDNKIRRKVVEHSTRGILNKIDEDILRINSENNKIKSDIVVKYDLIVEEFKGIYEKYNNKYILNKELLKLKNNEVESLIDDNNLSIEYKVAQITEYIKEIHAKEPEFLKEESLNKKNKTEYEAKYALYEVLCKNLNKEKTLVKVKEIIDINKELILIEQEVNRLKKELEEKEDYNYIVDSINEVMVEIGYDIISSDVMKKVNRTIIDNIYNFDDNNVLNVFTSDTGTIMFEVTGISNEKKEMSSLDKLKIKESMDDFCDKYSVIKEKLAERGILFGKENLKPAEEKYARIRVVSEEKYKVSNKISVKNKTYQSKYIN